MHVDYLPSQNRYVFGDVCVETICEKREHIIYRDLSLQVGGGLKYLHRSPASRKKRVVTDDVKGAQCSGV
jgi:hypothetical protein